MFNSGLTLRVLHDFPSQVFRVLHIQFNLVDLLHHQLDLRVFFVAKSFQNFEKEPSSTLHLIIQRADVGSVTLQGVDVFSKIRSRGMRMIAYVERNVL